MKIFETSFEVIEIRESGVKINHYLRGKKNNVKKDIELFKEKAKDYQMVGKKAMIVWA